MPRCRHCGYEAPRLDRCPLCGADSGEETDGGSPGAPPPWEERAVPFPRNFLDTWTGSSFRPDAFFRGVPWDEAAARPLLYYLLVSIVSALFGLWWTAAFAVLGDPMAAGPSDPLLDPFLAMSPAARALLGFFATPFAAVIALVFWCGLLHLFVLAFARRRRGFRATMRAVCYGSGPTLLSAVPIVGALVGFVWSLVLIAIGLREGHRMSGGAAAAVVALGVVIPFGFLFVLFAMLYASLGSIAPPA